MAILVILLIFVEFIITPKLVFAINPPTQISPTNNATVSSSKLIWETPVYSIYSNDPYRIQVDNDSDFSSVYRDYKTKNTFYTPVLTEGKWYWKIKAKDASGTWSDWGSIWSFNLSFSTTTPTPSSTTTPSPTAISTPSTSSSFTISNTPSQINADQLFNVTVNLSLSNKPNTSFYLKGAFRHPDKPTNYFGLTKVGSSWIKNSSSSSEQFPITTNSSGNWSGNLEIKPDANDSGFIGSGDYLFKVARYEGSNLTWSNESNIQITAVENTDQDTISSDSSSSTTAPSSSPQSGPSTKSKTASSQSKSYDRLVNRTASVAAATASATPFNFLPWIGGIFVLAGISSLIFIYLRAKKNI